ncbi:MAG: hypothetical protein ACXV3F_08195 [Frankiaceae bacterium]
MTALLALCASAVWGTSDFLGGILAKRMPALAVVFVSPGATVAVLVLLAVAGVAPLPPRHGGGGQHRQGRWARSRWRRSTARWPPVSWASSLPSPPRVCAYRC